MNRQLLLAVTISRILRESTRAKELEKRLSDVEDRLRHKYNLSKDTEVIKTTALMMMKKKNVS